MLSIKEGIMLEAVSVKDRVGIPSVKVLRSPSFPAYYDRAIPFLYCGCAKILLGFWAQIDRTSLHS